MPEASLHRPTWAEIDLSHLSFNLNSVRNFISADVACMAIVKADAYGHGAVGCARRLETDGVDWLGVAIPEEGVELRKAGIKIPILCLGGFWYGQENLLLEQNLTPVIFRIENAEWFDEAAKRASRIANIHIKVDTGMGRIGVPFEEIAQFAEHLKRFKNLNIEGILTHFAVANNLNENDFTNNQISQLMISKDILHEKGFNPEYVYMANSPGAVAHPASLGNMVRLGGILYGLGGDVLPQGIDKPELKPVLSLMTRIAHLKSVSSGKSLGYGRTFVTKRNSMIATIPIGYQDGYPRALSNRGNVIVRGAFAPVVGRVSMDWTIVDVTDIPHAAIDDEVVVIGEQNGLTITAEDLARNAGTISYEITCSLDSRIPRHLVGSESR